MLVDIRYNLPNTLRKVQIIIVPILETGKLKLKEVKSSTELASRRTDDSETYLLLC